MIRKQKHRGIAKLNEGKSIAFERFFRTLKNKLLNFKVCYYAQI